MYYTTKLKQRGSTLKSQSACPWSWSSHSCLVSMEPAHIQSRNLLEKEKKKVNVCEAGSSWCACRTVSGICLAQAHAVSRDGLRRLQLFRKSLFLIWTDTKVHFSRYIYIGQSPQTKRYNIPLPDDQDRPSFKSYPQNSPLSSYDWTKYKHN